MPCSKDNSLAVTKTSSVLRVLVLSLLVQAVVVSSSFGQLATTGVVSDVSNNYYADEFFGDSSTAYLKVPTPQGSFTQDFNAIGEVVWTVTWQAPAGKFIKIEVPTGWDSASLHVNYKAGLSGGVSHYDTSPTLTLLGEDGDLLGPYKDNTSHYMMVRPTSANTVNAVCYWDLTGGKTYYVTAIALSTTVPASINDNINAAVTHFQIGGNLSSYTSGCVPDPGQWLSIVDKPSGDIGVEQPTGNALVSGSSTVNFIQVEGSPVAPIPLDFLITNSGGASLTEIAASISGPDAENFTVTTAPATSISALGTSSATVTCTPVGTGDQTATLNIASDDPDESPFSISLLFTTLSYASDGDSDGMSDAAEHLLRDLGFDWQQTQTALVTTLRSNANKAGLYSTSEVQALYAPTPVISRDAGTGKFKLTMDWKKSTDLSTYLDYPVTAPEISINPQGDIEFEFTAPDNAAFYKLEVN